MADESFHGYTLQRVDHSLTPALQDEIVAFWQRNRALPAGVDAHERSKQVFLTARSAQGAIVGLCTVYVANYGEPPQPHHFYRMFVEEAARHGGLPFQMWRRATEMLQADYLPGKPAGLVMEVENESLMHPSVHRLILAAGYELKGKNARGCDVWLKRFAERDNA